MAKNKPLPPLRSSDKPSSQGPPLPAGGSSTGRPREERTPVPVPSESPVLQLSPLMALKPDVEILSPPRYESCAQHCPANEDRFNSLAAEMSKGGWELIAVVEHKKFVSMGRDHGMSNGWMTFWKRIAQPQTKESEANESA